MDAALEKPIGRTRFWSLFPWLMLATGVAASLVSFALIQDAVENVAELRFQSQAADTKAALEHRVNFYADILYGMKALFASQGMITRAQFHAFVESLDLKNRYPGFDVVNYMVYVPDRERAAFEQAVRRDTSLQPSGYPDFAIKPPGQRDAYYVIVYVEPMRGFEFAFGLDLGANPLASDPQALAAAVRLTRDSGQLITSGIPLRIKTAGGEYIGLAMRLAVYREGMPTDTVEQRRKAFLGSVGAGFNVENLMKGAIAGEKQQYMRFAVHDAGSAIDGAAPDAAVERRLLFDSAQLQATPPARPREDPAATFVHVLPLEIGGRHWEVHFSASKADIIDRVDALLPWLILGGGLLSTGLLCGMVYSLTSSRGRALEIAADITKDLRESEQALQASTQQLQAMSRRLVDVQESERRDLARELHDRVGQDLTALSITLDILSTQLAGSGNATVSKRLDDAAQLLESTSGTIENVMSELRPPMLDDYGLLPALQWYATQFSGRTGIEVKVRGEEAVARLPQAREIALFRITQEALNNVAKHAHAVSVEIGVEHAAGSLTLSIADDGIGLESPAPGSAKRQGLGMVTMRERTQSVGGEFAIASSAGEGTRVVVRVPCA